MNTNIIRHCKFYRIRIVPTPYASESIIQFLEVDLFLIVLNFNTHTHTHNGRYEIIPATSNPLNSVTHKQMNRNLQGCDRRRYYVIYVNVFKIDVIYIIFDFEDIIRYFCQNETLFLSKLDVIFIFLGMPCFCRRGQ